MRDLVGAAHHAPDLAAAGAAISSRASDPREARTRRDRQRAIHPDHPDGLRGGRHARGGSPRGGRGPGARTGLPAERSADLLRVRATVHGNPDVPQPASSDRGLVQEHVPGRPPVVSTRAGAPGIGADPAGVRISVLAGAAGDRTGGARRRGDRGTAPGGHGRDRALCAVLGAGVDRNGDPGGVRAGLPGGGGYGAVHRAALDLARGAQGGMARTGVRDGRRSERKLTQDGGTQLPSRSTTTSCAGMRPPSTRPAGSTRRWNSTDPIARARESAPIGESLASSVCPPPRLNSGTRAPAGLAARERRTACSSSANDRLRYGTAPRSVPNRRVCRPWLVTSSTAALSSLKMTRAR